MTPLLLQHGDLLLLYSLESYQEVLLFAACCLHLHLNLLVLLLLPLPLQTVLGFSSEQLHPLMMLTTVIAPAAAADLLLLQTVSKSKCEQLQPLSDLAFHKPHNRNCCCCCHRRLSLSPTASSCSL
jgi:hypothetical protein